MIKSFGITKNGQEAHLFTLENENTIVTLCEHGARMVSFIDKKTGTDILQGFDDVSGFEKMKSMGASVGRVCNRITKGTFTLNGKEYHTEINEYDNTRHSGSATFANKMFAYDVQGNKVTFSLESPDGEGGFPGNLHVDIIYELKDDGLYYTFSGTSDKDTPLSVTNHAYFNLNGPADNSVLDHELLVCAESFMGIDPHELITGEVIKTEGTPFDFREFKRIGKDIDVENEQLKNGIGYDHHFVIDGEGMRKHCELRSDVLDLEVWSDLPGVQVYTSNTNTGEFPGKQGGTFPARSSICLETQYVPDALNHPEVEQPVLKAGGTLKHTTIYKLHNR